VKHSRPMNFQQPWAVMW